MMSSISQTIYIGNVASLLPPFFTVALLAAVAMFSHQSLYLFLSLYFHLEIEFGILEIEIEKKKIERNMNGKQTN